MSGASEERQRLLAIVNAARAVVEGIGDPHSCNPGICPWCGGYADWENHKDDCVFIALEDALDEPIPGGEPVS